MLLHSTVAEVYDRSNCAAPHSWKLVLFAVKNCLLVADLCFSSREIPQRKGIVSGVGLRSMMAMAAA